MRGWLALALGASACALAQGAAAQDSVRVRAGEHDGYSRIVLDAPSTAALAWGVEGRSLVVRLDAPVTGFDTGPAVAARGISRVAGYAANPAEAGAVLRVTMTCDCGARVMRLADGRVVLDIASGAPRPDLPEGTGAAAASAEPAAPTTIAAPAPRPAPRPAVSAAEPAPSAVAPETPSASPPAAPATTEAAAAAAPQPAETATPVPEAAPAPAEPLPVALPQPPTPSPAAEPEPPAEIAAAATEAPAQPAPPEDATAATVAAARQALLRQLTRAAEEGLLDLADRAETPRADPPADPPAGAADEAAPPPADLPMRVRTGTEIAADADRARQGAAPQPAQPAAHCLDAAQFDTASWVGEASLNLQLGMHRRAMVGEFDRANTAAVLAYVRLLIAKGFGLEAEGALRAFVSDLPATPVLWELAPMVDSRAPDPDGVVAAGLDCPGAHGLWAAAAQALAGTLDPAAIDIERLRGPLGLVPPLIRTRLAVPVATVALDAGDIDTAETIAAIAARAEAPPPEGDGMLAVLMARIDAARGSWSRAEAGLRPLIWQTSPAGIEAAIRMVEFRLAQGNASPSGLAENMEALAFTLGRSDLARRLIQSAAAARAKGEGLGLALAALGTLAERGSDPGAARLAARDILVDYAPDETEGVAYAEAVLAHEAMLGTDPGSDPARFAIARHFTALGLGNLSEHILAPALQRDVAGARLIAADAAIVAADPQRALDFLGNLDGGEAARLRAAALAAEGRFDAAFEAISSADEPQLAARYAWLAGRWETAAGAGSAAQRILASWMAGETEMPDDLRAAAATDPQLAARLEAFTRDPAAAGTSVLEEALEALEAARRRRALMGELLGDG